MFGYLMRNRVIFIGSRINDEVCQSLSLISICLFPAHVMSRAQQTLCAHRALTLVSLPQVATRTVASLLAMEAMDETADIKMYINSPGTLFFANFFPESQF